MTAISLSTTQAGLNEAFGVTEADLAANRAGRLGPSQEQMLARLMNHGRSWSRRAVLIATVSFGAFTVPRFLSSTGADTPAVLFIVVVAALLVLASRSASRSQGRYEAELRQRPVEAAEGVPEVFKIPVDGFAELSVGSLRRASLTADQARALEPGRRYRVYVLDYGYDTRQVLAVEALPED